MRLHWKDASQQRRHTARRVQHHGIDKQQELQKRVLGVKHEGEAAAGEQATTANVLTGDTATRAGQALLQAIPSKSHSGSKLRLRELQNRQAHLLAAMIRCRSSSSPHLPYAIPGPKGCVISGRMPVSGGSLCLGPKPLFCFWPSKTMNSDVRNLLLGMYRRCRPFLMIVYLQHKKL